MPETPLLKVYANPFCAGPDHEGRACGAIRYEPTGVDDEFDASLPYIAATVIATPKKKGSKGKPKPGTKLHHVVRTRRASGSEQDVDYDHEWEFHPEPAYVEHTPYYMMLLTEHGQHGPALLPADEATTKAVFGQARPHRDPLMRLHQYSRERSLIPRLRLNDTLIKASKSAHLARCAELGKGPSEVEFQRDPEAEWHAFVGEDVVKARAEHEAREAAAMKRITGESVAPPNN